MAITFKSALVKSLEKKEFWKGCKLQNNEKLTDDSGFIPLDIRFKKLDIATAQRKLALSQFDYRDYDELLDDDVVFSQYDSLEELQEKLDIYTTKKKEILARKFAEYSAARQNGANEQAKNQPSQAENKTTTQTNSNTDTTK